MDDLAVTDVETSRTFWSTVAQIAGVFIIPLVFEARRAAARWQYKTRRQKAFQAIFFYGSSGFLASCITFALFSLSAPGRLSLVHQIAWPLGLAIVAFGLAVVPLAPYVVVTSRKAFIIQERAMPWSRWRSQRRRWRKMAQEIAEDARDLLATRERLLKSREELRESTRGLRATVARVRGLTPKEYQRALSEAGDLTEDERNVMEGIRRGDDSVFKESRSALRASAAVLRDLNASVERLAGLADRIDAGWESFTNMSHFTDEERAAIEEAIALVEADAADALAAATVVRGNAEQTTTANRKSSEAQESITQD